MGQTSISATQPLVRETRGRPGLNPNTVMDFKASKGSSQSVMLLVVLGSAFSWLPPLVKW